MQERIVRHGQYLSRVISWGDGGGPHAVVLPGLSASMHSLTPQIRLLRRLGFTTHVIELPGFGLGPPLRREDARFPQLARYVIEATRAVGVDRALFLGHSLGGGVALHVALQAPGLVHRLVLLAPAAVGQSLLWIYRLFCLPLVGRALLRPYKRGSPRWARHFLVGSQRGGDARFVDFVCRQDRLTPRQALSVRAVVWANAPSFWKKLLVLLVPGGEQSAFTLRLRLAELRHIPTLVLWGSEDRVICALDAETFRHANPDAEVHVARGVGHSLPLEVPEWVDAYIARFARRSGVPQRAAA